MEKISLLEGIDSSQDLFSIPPILGEVLEAVEAEDACTDKIAEIILKDVSLTAKVLRMSNSSYYKIGAEITTVHQAVRVLGANAVKCIALSVSVFASGNTAELGDYDVRLLYSHCLGVGVLSRAIAQKLGLKNVEEAFVAGLLHDLGRLFVFKAYPALFAEIERRIEHGEDVIPTEREYFDVDHAELGGIIANRWGLPEALQEVMAGHHDPPTEGKHSVFVKIVRLANLVANSIEAQSVKRVESQIGMLTEASKQLDLDQEFINSLTFVMLDETIKAASSVGVDLGDPAEMLNRANRELCKTYLMIEGLFRERQELSGKMLAEERVAGMMRSKNIALATLSHYLNNIATAISGRAQLMQMALDSGQLIDKTGKMPIALQVIESSINKILAVLAELKSVTKLEDQDFYNDTDAINIDKRIQERMAVFEESAANN